METPYYVAVKLAGSDSRRANRSIVLHCSRDSASCFIFIPSQSDGCRSYLVLRVTENNETDA